MHKVEIAKSTPEFRVSHKSVEYSRAQGTGSWDATPRKEIACKSNSRTMRMTFGMCDTVTILLPIIGAPAILPSHLSSTYL